MTRPCMHCGQVFKQHAIQGDPRHCHDGEHIFNSVITPCEHCGEPFEQHEAHSEGRRCPVGENTFDHVLASPCMHCGEPFKQHEANGNQRRCPDGKHAFNHVFHMSPDAIDFLIAHPDTPAQELAARWIQHVSRVHPHDEKTASASEQPALLVHEEI